MNPPSRKIIHVDMDAFFASVEIRDNPKLKGKPVAVGGKADSRGVIATCNYEARKYGIHSAMASAEAKRRCPSLILIKGRMETYREVSAQIHQIFRRYTDIIEPLSLDEAYLDVTDCPHCRGSATLIAEQIRKEIFAVTQLTASAGIAPNKFLAKVASDENKPNGQCVITPDKAADFAAQLPLRKYPGVGPRTQERLAALGLMTGADIVNFSPTRLNDILGKFGTTLFERAQGIDERPVRVNRERKSVGIETTLEHDLTTTDQCWPVLQTLREGLQKRLKSRPFNAITVKLKFQDFQITTVTRQGNEITDDRLHSLLEIAFQRAEKRRIRLLGLSVTLNPDTPTEQLSLQLETE